MSKSGKNYGYSAQCMARWIFDAEQYEEQHTALEDSKMEFELARHFARKHKKDFEKLFLGNPKSVSWRMLKRNYPLRRKCRNNKITSPIEVGGTCRPALKILATFLLTFSMGEKIMTLEKKRMESRKLLLEIFIYLFGRLLV